MKKSKLKTILILLIIIVLCLSVGVYAGYTLSATEVSYTKSDGTTVSVKDALDELRTGLPTKSVGDEVTVGGEQFYVLEWDNNSDVVRLISKYNLNTAGTAQQNASYSTTGSNFSSTIYWSDSFTSSPFNLNDFYGYTLTDAIGKAKSYGISKGALSSRLLSYEEAHALYTKSWYNEKIGIMLWGEENTGGYLLFWLGSTGSKSGVWRVNGNNRTLNYNDYEGIYYNSSTWRCSPGYNYIKI